MKRHKLKLLIPLFICTIMISSSCEVIEDCIFWPAKPNIKTTQISEGFVDQSYYQEIAGEVKNDRDDSDYDYNFQLIGDLPIGLNYDLFGNKLIIRGIPKENGEFNFKLIMEIYPLDNDSNPNESDSDNICLENDTAEREYTLIIN